MWQEKTNLRNGVKLSTKFWWVFFCNLGVGVLGGVWGWTLGLGSGGCCPFSPLLKISNIFTLLVHPILATIIQSP
jgi:hypothetical protein